MKYHLVLWVCCAATILAAPVKDEETEKLSVEVKPADLQLKVSPTKIDAKFVKPEIIISTSTTSTTSTTEASVEEPIEEPKKATKADTTPQKEEEAVKKPVNDKVRNFTFYVIFSRMFGRKNVFYL